MNEAQRKQADVAFACYLGPTAWLSIMFLLYGYNSIRPQAEENVLLVLWFVLLPLAMASCCATLVAVLLSLRLRGAWLMYPGLFVVPLALVPLLVVILWDVGKVWPWLPMCSYMLISCFFCFRWFSRQRRHAVQEPSQSSTAWPQE
jgi:hypothetical protein